MISKPIPVLGPQCELYQLQQWYLAWATDNHHKHDHLFFDSIHSRLSNEKNQILACFCTQASNKTIVLWELWIDQQTVENTYDHNHQHKTIHA